MRRRLLHGTRRGFSLVELMVVIGVLAILMSIGYAALYRGRSMSKDIVCQNNLKQISAALNLYQNAHGTYPTDYLSSSLAPYVRGGEKTFICPLDKDPQGDSYSEFYIASSDFSTLDYVCGCPRHLDGVKMVALYSSSSVRVLSSDEVRWNAQMIPPGTKVGSGILTFADGSEVTIPRDMCVRLVQSYRQSDGRLHSIISADINEQGTLRIQVTPGSRFEVVTPAAIAGVKGTRFMLTTTVEDKEHKTEVHVLEGAVYLKERWKDKKPKTIEPGKKKGMEAKRVEVIRRLPREWFTRRVILPDDQKYEDEAREKGWLDDFQNPTVPTDPADPNGSTGGDDDDDD